jgi:hypothetical protein
MSQTASVKLHVVSKWSLVSNSQKQSAHWGSHGQFFFARLFAVGALPSAAGQAKNWHLGTTLACQMLEALNYGYAPPPKLYVIC